MCRKIRKSQSNTPAATPDKSNIPPPQKKPKKGDDKVVDEKDDTVRYTLCPAPQVSSTSKTKTPTRKIPKFESNTAAATPGKSNVPPLNKKQRKEMTKL